MVLSAKYGSISFTEIPKIVLSDERDPVFDDTSLFNFKDDRKRFYHEVKVNVEANTVVFNGKEVKEINIDEDVYITEDELADLNIDHKKLQIARTPGRKGLKIVGKQNIVGYTDIDFQATFAGQYTVRQLSAGSGITVEEDLEKLLGKT